MGPIARDVIYAVAVGVTFGVAWHNRRQIRKWAGQARWKVDRHGHFLRQRQMDIRLWLLELSTYCAKESATLREYDAMLYEGLVDLRDQVEELR